MSCKQCERLNALNDGLRDRCGSLELINEGLHQRAIAALNVDPNTDLNGRVAVLQLDRAVRRIAELESELLDLQARMNPPGPPAACPQCDEPMVVEEVPVTVDPDTGYRDGGVVASCGGCGERLDMDDAPTVVQHACEAVEPPAEDSAREVLGALVPFARMAAVAPGLSDDCFVYGMSGTAASAALYYGHLRVAGEVLRKYAPEMLGGLEEESELEYRRRIA